MTTISTRVRINGKNVVIKRTFEKDEASAAIKEFGEQVRQLRKSVEAKKKSTRQGYRKKKSTPTSD